MKLSFIQYGVIIFIYLSFLTYFQKILVGLNALGASMAYRHLKIAKEKKNH